MSSRKTTLFYAVLISVASLAVQMVNVPVSNSAPLSGPLDASTFKNIAKAQVPTVVNIQTEARARTRELTDFFGGEGGGQDLFERFFGGRGQRPVPPGQR